MKNVSVPDFPQASHAGPCNRKEFGDLSRLSRSQGVRLIVRFDLDQRNGSPAILRCRLNICFLI